MSFIGEFIIDFIGEAIASSPTLQRVLLWILFLCIRASHVCPGHNG